MINVFALLDIASDAVGHESIGQIIADGRTLYGVYTKTAGGQKFDPAVMARDGSLKPTVDAAARTLKTLSDMLADPKQAAHVMAVLGVRPTAAAGGPSTGGTPL